MNIIEIILGIFAGLYTILGVISLGALGQRLHKISASQHVNLGLGFGIYYLLFMSISLVLSPKFVYLFFLLLFGICIIINWKGLMGGIKVFFRSLPSLWTVLLFLFILPLFFRLFSPPTSVDGLSSYLPSVEWVHINGLEFNPYLTKYTTMPMAVEYLYSIPFGLGGQFGVRFLDCLFSILLLHLLYGFCKKLLSPNASKVVLGLSVLLPGSFFFLFGTGKIDTINAYLLLLAFIVLIRNWKNENYNGAIILFSTALAIKYTNWPLLAAPLFILNVRTIILQPGFAKLLLPLMGVLFAGSVLLKNQIQVNNPLAPIYTSQNQSRFIESHGNLPNGSGPGFDLETEDKIPVQFSIIKLVTFLLPALVILALFVLYRNKNTIPHLWVWILFLFCSLLPWFGLTSFSSQPLRFIWPQIMLLIILIIRALEVLTSRIKAQKWTFTPLLSLVLLGLLYNAYGRHWHHIPNFFLSQKMDLATWYAEVDRNQYGISKKIVAEGYQFKDVAYFERVCLGIVPVADYGLLPTDKQQRDFHTNKQKHLEQKEYIFDRKGQLIKAGIDTSEVILKSGEFYLIRNLGRSKPLPDNNERNELSNTYPKPS